MQSGTSIQPNSNNTAGEIINLAADLEAFVAMLCAPEGFLVQPFGKSHLGPCQSTDTI
jgi:hypothetical protein